MRVSLLWFQFLLNTLDNNNMHFELLNSRLMQQIFTFLQSSGHFIPR